MPEQLRVLWLWQPQSHTATIVQELALKNDKFTPVAPSPFREKAKKPVNRGPPVPRISSRRQRGGPGGGRDGAHGPSAPVYQVAAAAEEQQPPDGGARIKREAISISSNDSHQPMDTTSSRAVPSRMDTTSRPGSDWVGRRLDPRFATWDGFNPPRSRAPASSRRSMSVSSGASSSPSTVQPRASAAPPLTSPAARKTLLANLDRLLPPQHPLRTELRALQSVKRFTQKSIDRLYALEGAVSAPPAVVPQPAAPPPVVVAQQPAPRPPSILREPNAPPSQHRVTIQQLPEYEEGRPSSLEGILDEIQTVQRKRKEDARAESRQRAPTPAPVRTRSPILRRSRPASRQSEAAAASSSGDEEMEEINRQALARAAKTQSQQAPPTALYSFNPRLTSELRLSSVDMNPLLERETPSTPGSEAAPPKRARSAPPEREREFRPRPISTLLNTDDNDKTTSVLSVLFNFQALGRERRELERKQERVLQLQRQELQRQLLEEKQAEEREREERQRQFEEGQEQEREARQRQFEADEAEDRERLENLTRARRSGAKTKAIAATYSSSSSEAEVGAETPPEERERKRARRSGAKSAAIAGTYSSSDEAANQRLQEFQRAAYERKRQTAREKKRLNKIERRHRGELRREEVRQEEERMQREEERDKEYDRREEKRLAKNDRREAAREAREEAYERARRELAEQQERERQQLEEEQERQRQEELRHQEEEARIEREQKERAAQQAQEAETARQAAALLQQQQKEAVEAERRRQAEEKRKSDALAAKAAATKRQEEVDRLEAEQRALQQKAEQEAAAAREESKRLAAELAEAERKAQQLAEEQRAEAERARREQQERERQQRLDEQRKQKEADEKRQRELDELERLRQEQELARERRLQELTVPPIAPTPPEAPRMETTKPLALPPPAAVQPTRSLEPQHELQTPPTAPLMETTAPLVLPSAPSTSQAMESVEPELELPSTKVIEYLDRLKRERAERELQLQREAKVRQAELASNIADAVLESTLAKPNAGVAELAAAIQTAAEAEEHLELMASSGEVTPTNDGSVIMESGSGTPKSAFSMVSGVSQISSGDRAVQTLRQAAEQLRRSSPTSSILLGDDAEAMNVATPSSSILLPTPMEVERQKAIREAEQVLAARAVARPEAAFATPPVAAQTPMEVEKRQAVLDAAQQLAQMNRPTSSSPPPMGNTPPVAVQAPVPRRAVNVNPANPSATARALVSEMRSRARDRQMSAARPTTPTLSPAVAAAASETSSPPASIAPTLMYGTHIDVNERPPTPGSEFSQTLEPPTAASVLLERPPGPTPAPPPPPTDDDRLSTLKAHVGDALEDVLQYTSGLLHEQRATLTKRKPTIKRIGASEVRHIRSSLITLTDELSQTRPEELKLEKLQVATAKNTIMRLLGEQTHRARQPPAKALAGINSDLAELQSVANEERFSFLGPSTSARAPVQEVREPPAPAAVKVVINNQGGNDTTSDSDTSSASSVSSQSSVRSRIPRPSHEPPKEAFARARNTWANPEARREREAFRRREQRELDTARKRQSDKNPIVYSSSESEQPEQQQLEDYEDSDDDDL